MDTFKSKKIGMLSDLHIGVRQDSELWHETALDFAEWSSKKFEALGITEIAILGDVFDNRSEISVRTLGVAQKFFEYFKEFQLVVPVGNHDCYKKYDSDVHSLGLLNGWKNVEIVDTPRVFKTTMDKTISVLPWGTSLEEMPTADIMFGHMDIKSFYMNGYNLCEHGFESADLFLKSRYVISGHFHKRDLREYSKGKILYLGSPYQMNFGEVGDERGIYVFDLEKETFDFIENTISPKHQKIKISELISKKIKSSDLQEMVPNNIVSLIVDHPIKPDTQAMLLSKIQNLSPKFLKPDFDLPDIDISSDGNDGSEAVDISVIIDEYIDGLDTENKEPIKKYIGELYQKYAV